MAIHSGSVRTAITPISTTWRKISLPRQFPRSSEVSNDGWPWSTSARARTWWNTNTDFLLATRRQSGHRGLNRSERCPATVAQRQASDPFSGEPFRRTYPTVRICYRPGRYAAPDGPNMNQYGYYGTTRCARSHGSRLWFFVDTTCYNVAACQTPLAHDPFATNTSWPTGECRPGALYRSVLSRFDPRSDYYRSRSGSGTSIPIMHGGLAN